MKGHFSAFFKELPYSPNMLLWSKTFHTETQSGRVTSKFASWRAQKVIFGRKTTIVTSLRHDVRASGRSHWVETTPSCIPTYGVSLETIESETWSQLTLCALGGQTCPLQFFARCTKTVGSIILIFCDFYIQIPHLKNFFGLKIFLGLPQLRI